MALQHIIGIDDGPLRKFEDPDVLVVGVVMAGRERVEGVLTTRLSIDGDGVTEKLAAWIGASRFQPILRAILFDGITIAGLSIIDLPHLGERTGLPVIAVTRRPPSAENLEAALRAAELEDRIPLIERAGPAHRWRRIHFECAGIDAAGARGILEEQSGRSHLPEAVRLAHLIAGGVTLGESRGRP